MSRSTILLITFLAVLFVVICVAVAFFQPISGS
jgi:hypothetical protein